MNKGSFQVYRTSAGAGKTYTIVKEFIKLNLTGQSRYDSVAAITFTNKAANEMKDRITEYLFAISQKHTHKNEINNLMNSLSEETGLSHSQITEKCGKILHEILHNYARFCISTIDSFIHDILRIFSHDLRLPDNFSVETDSKMLAEMIVSELLLGLEQNPNDPDIKKLSGYVVDLALNRFEEKDNWDITSELKTFAGILFSEDGMNYIPDISKYSPDDFSKAASELHILQQQFLHHVSTIGKTAMDIIAQNGLQAEDFYYSKTGIWGYFEKASNANAETELYPNTRVLTTINDDKWTTKGGNIPPHITTQLRESYQSIISHPLMPNYKLLAHIRSLIGPMALMGRMQHILNEYQRQNQVLPISTFNKLISNVVRNEPAPFIYERLGQKFKHYLIDEFQDTSVMQWQNFLPLIDNALSQANTTMIVGDVKQSIYRFRNGEMEQLMNLPQIYKKPIETPHFDDIEMSMNYCMTDVTQSQGFENTNYRSGQYIVELNNSHFEYIKKVFEQSNENHYVGKAYENLTQKYAPHAHGKGSVRFYPIEGDAYRENALKNILQIVQSHPKKGDIAILTRGNAAAAEIASFLMQQNPPIPVISSESLQLGFSPSVRFIIQMLQFLYDENNHIAVVAAYTYLQQNHPTVNNLFSRHDSWLNEVIASTPVNKRADAFEKFLQDCGFDLKFSQLRAMPLHEMLSVLISTFGLSTPPDAYILFFQNKINDFLTQSHEGIAGALKWWEENGKTTPIIIPEGTDAVRILSVHKSKGLQFPIVIYPFADFKLRDTNSYIWTPSHLLPEQVSNAMNMPQLQHILMKLSVEQKIQESALRDYIQDEIFKQELDTLNIHYVAMTRAKEHLHVLYKKPGESKNGKVSNVNQLLHSYVMATPEQWQHEENESVTSYHFGSTASISENKNEETQGQPQLEAYIIRKAGSLKTRVAKNKKSRARKTGELFHNMVADIDVFDNNTDMYFEEFCKKQQTSESQKETLKKMLHQFIKNQTVEKLFSVNMKHYNETAIIDGINVYRPDKIVYNDSETWVIDFKTGKKSESHHTQIKNYCRLLKEMGFKNISALLVYVSETGVETLQTVAE